MHVVSVLEAMPVQETADAVADLRAHDLPVGAVVANMVRTPLLPAAALAGAAAGVDAAHLRPGLTSAGLDADLAVPLAAEATDHARRLALEESLRDELAGVGPPVLTLPQLPDGVDAAGLEHLADVLAGEVAA